jgi:hypothetical protein
MIQNHDLSETAVKNESPQTKQQCNNRKIKLLRGQIKNKYPEIFSGYVHAFCVRRTSILNR